MKLIPGQWTLGSVTVNGKPVMHGPATITAVRTPGITGKQANALAAATKRFKAKVVK